MPFLFHSDRRAAGLTAALVAGAALLALPVASAPAGSKTPPAPSAAPVPAEPGLTTATFGDWVLRCQRAGTEAGAPRVCEVGEVVQVQGQQNPIARLAIGRIKQADPLRLTILLPPNVSFPSIVRIGLTNPDGSGLDVPWRRCLPGACMADAEIRDETLKAWRGASDQGRIAFKDAGGRDITVPLSFKGFAQALDALAKEPRDQ